MKLLQTIGEIRKKISKKMSIERLFLIAKSRFFLWSSFLDVVVYGSTTVMLAATAADVLNNNEDENLSNKDILQNDLSKARILFQLCDSLEDRSLFHRISFGTLFFLGCQFGIVGQGTKFGVKSWSPVQLLDNLILKLPLLILRAVDYTLFSPVMYWFMVKADNLFEKSRGMKTLGMPITHACYHSLAYLYLGISGILSIPKMVYLVARAVNSPVESYKKAKSLHPYIGYFSSVVSIVGGLASMGYSIGVPLALGSVAAYIYMPVLHSPRELLMPQTFISVFNAVVGNIVNMYVSFRHRCKAIVRKIMTADERVGYAYPEVSRQGSYANIASSLQSPPDVSTKAAKRSAPIPIPQPKQEIVSPTDEQEYHSVRVYNPFFSVSSKFTSPLAKKVVDEDAQQLIPDDAETEGHFIGDTVTL